MPSSAMRQVKLAPELHQRFKSHAKTRHIPLSQLHNEAIYWFIGERALCGSTYQQYLCSPTNGVTTSLWVTTDASDQIKAIASADGTFDTRVIYTSLYLFERQVLQPAHRRVTVKNK